MVQRLSDGPPYGAIEQVARKCFGQSEFSTKIKRFLNKAWTSTGNTMRKELAERRQHTSGPYEFLEAWMEDVVGRLNQAMSFDDVDYFNEFASPDAVVELFLALHGRSCVPREFIGDDKRRAEIGRMDFLSTVQRVFRSLGINVDASVSKKRKPGSQSAQPAQKVARSSEVPAHLIDEVVDEYFWIGELQTKVRKFLKVSWPAVLKTAQIQCDEKSRPNRPIEFIYAWADDVIGRLQQAASNDAIPRIEDCCWVEYMIDFFVSLADSGCIPAEFEGPVESHAVARAMYKIYGLLLLDIGEGGYTGPSAKTRQTWAARKHGTSVAGGAYWGGGGGGGRGGAAGSRGRRSPSTGVAPSRGWSRRRSSSRAAEPLLKEGAAPSRDRSRRRGPSRAAEPALREGRGVPRMSGASPRQGARKSGSPALARARKRHRNALAELSGSGPRGKLTMRGGKDREGPAERSIRGGSRSRSRSAAAVRLRDAETTARRVRGLAAPAAASEGSGDLSDAEAPVACNDIYQLLEEGATDPGLIAGDTSFPPCMPGLPVARGASETPNPQEA